MSEESKKFNWLAFLFSSAYYAGRGKVKKGLLLALIGFIPLTQIGVGIYTGKKANSELEGDQFSWLKFIFVFICHISINTTALSIIKVFKG